MIAWPETLPKLFERNDFSYAKGDARVRAGMDAGYKMRSNLSYVPDQVQGSIVMTTAQREIFERFVQDDLKRGVLPFTFPIKGGTEHWICQIGQPMPSWSPHAVGQWIVRLALVVFPQ